MTQTFTINAFGDSSVAHQPGLGSVLEIALRAPEVRHSLPMMTIKHVCIGFTENGRGADVEFVLTKTVAPVNEEIGRRVARFAPALV